MGTFWAMLLFLIVPCIAHSSPADAVRVSIIRTGNITIPEKFAFAGGRLFTTITLNHSAVLVDHPKGRVMFDTGLGEKIDTQFASDMPWWGHALFSYKTGVTASRQLNEAKERLPDAIVLSHGHWDHASGLADFKSVPIWMEKEELAFLKAPHPGSVFASQFNRLEGRIKPMSLESAASGNYSRSRDLFGDGRVIVIGMPGHTPGSIGLLVHTSGGREFFFVGDVVWSANALKKGSPKFWVPRRVVDHDAKAAYEAVIQLKKFTAANPDVTVVPAHDGLVQDSLGYFPKWIN